jgi:hypothetical protein
MRWEQSTASQCRWSEYAEELFYDWNIIWDNSYADYQGTGEFVAEKDGKFAYVTWTYGSCSGCDAWEDMPEDEVRKDFKNGVEYFNDIHELERWASFVQNKMLIDALEERRSEFEKKFDEDVEEVLVN